MAPLKIETEVSDCYLADEIQGTYRGMMIARLCCKNFLRTNDPHPSPFVTHCTAANLSDDAGLIEMLAQNIAYFQSKPVNIPKLTILLDHGYHPEHLT